MGNFIALVITLIVYGIVTAAGFALNYLVTRSALKRALTDAWKEIRADIYFMYGADTPESEEDL